MDAVSQHGGRARLPMLESKAARLGVFVVVALSIVVGCVYWWQRDPALAVLTVGAELVAFAGLAIARHQFSCGAWRLGWGALLVTLIAAAWCGMTMFENIDARSRAEAIARAQEMPRYTFALSAAETARDLLRDRLRRPEPRPACNCPQTVAAWEASEAAAIERLTRERDNAVAEMQAAIPPPQTDWIAIARGIGVEVAKLLGFMVFGLAVAPLARASAQQEPWRPQVVAGTEAPPAQLPTHPPARPLTLRRVVGWRPLLAGILGWGVASTQQIPEPTVPPALPARSPSAPAQPVEPLVETVDVVDLRHAAAQLSARRMGERRIAAHLTRETGREVTRWQVRKLLGRVAA